MASQMSSQVQEGASSGDKDPTQVFLDVLFSDIPDRNLVSLAVCNEYRRVSTDS
jgi:hypothetical protein